MPQFTRLVIGEDPVLPSFTAYDSNGTRITELTGTARIRDSSVVRFAGGLLYPVGIGGTSLEVDFGGIATYQPIQVVRRIVSQRFALSAGEIHTWSLPVGRSELFVATDSMNATAESVLLHAYRANCARGPRRKGEQHWFCIGTTASRAVLWDTRPVGTRGAVHGQFMLFALP